MHEAIPYAILWLVAVVSSACRSIRDDDFKFSRNLFGSALTSGFVALGIIAILDYSLGGTGVDFTFGRGLYLGISSLAGALRSEQEALATFLLKKLWGAQQKP